LNGEGVAHSLIVLSGSDKSNVEFNQYPSIEINKVDTIYSGTPFSLQPFDILRVSKVRVYLWISYFFDDITTFLRL
jgi:hypothetical protein